jgi:ATP-dependent Clp protease ATP-binding subunit ClpC
MAPRTFNEPRLSLSAPGEFLVRLISYSSYVVLSAIALVCIASNIPSLQWFSVLLILFLVDRVLHVGQGEETIAELGGSRRQNVALATAPATYRVLNHSFRKSRAIAADWYLVLLAELTGRGDVRESLRRLDVPLGELMEKVNGSIHAGTDGEGSATPERIEALMLTAHASAQEMGERFIEPRNLFVALAMTAHPALARVFELFDLAPEDIQEAAIFGRWRASVAGIRRLPAVLGGFAHRPRFIRHRIMNRAWTARPTPLLDRFSTDLTDLARAESVGFLVGHEKEFETLLQVIARPGKPNALLVGEPGSGKSTLIAHLAFRMVKDKVPPVLFDKRLISLDIGGLVADAAPDVLAGRLHAVTDEVLLAGNIVLCIPNVHDLFRTTQAKAMNAIDIILPVVKNAGIPVIGETFPREFKQLIEPRTDFLDQFEVVRVEEVSEAEAVRFLVYSSLLLEREFKVTVTFRAIRKAVSIAHRYFKNKMLPGSALDLLKQALAKASSERQKVLEESGVIAVAELQSRVPIHAAGEVETAKLLNLEALIHERLVDQEAAVSAVSRALREYRSGLARKGGPIATFLFVGPTGVGKTELAKTLAALQFGSKDLMHRFDMSEYQEKSSLQRFIGTPDGERTGALTDAVLAAPYSLILLDEFEKAHPDILNLFLQVFDDGRLTDSLDRTVDFSNTIIIATSNAHSEFIKAEIERGRSSEEISDDLKKKLTEYFKPELINRFSDVIVFRGLRIEEVRTIAGFFIQEVTEALRESHGIDLTADDAALAKLAELGWSPVFGARPLRAVVSERVRSVLAEKVLRKEIARGNSLLLVCEDGRLEFKVTA